jgi:hypothetical protein
MNEKVVNEKGDGLAPIEMESPQRSRKQNDDVKNEEEEKKKLSIGSGLGMDSG